MEEEEKVVGILGGMGPEATVDLMQRIIRLTPAKDDIDHIRCIVDNNPKVPSRIKAIVEGGDSNPGPCMAEMGQRLESWGADFLVIACNTAHAYYNFVQEAVTIPVIHLINLVIDHVREIYPAIKQIGIIGSTTIKITSLYEKRLKQFGIDAIYPDSAHQQSLFNIVKTIKTGNTGSNVINEYRKVCKNLADNGVEKTIVACTELSVLNDVLSMDSLDAAEILAQEIVAIVKNRKTFDK